MHHLLRDSEETPRDLTARTVITCTPPPCQLFRLEGLTPSSQIVFIHVIAAVSRNWECAVDMGHRTPVLLTDITSVSLFKIQMIIKMGGNPLAKENSTARWEVDPLDFTYEMH